MSTIYLASRYMLSIQSRYSWTWFLPSGRLLSSACMHAKSLQSCLILCDPMDCIAHKAPLSMGFSRQEHWGKVPFPSPGDLPNPRIKPGSLTSPALAGGFLPLVPPGKPIIKCSTYQIPIVGARRVVGAFSEDAQKASICPTGWWMHVWRREKEGPNLLNFLIFIV